MSSAVYCIAPPPIPDLGKATVLNSGLKFGPVCRGSGSGFEAYPSCPEFKIKKSSGTGQSQTDFIVNYTASATGQRLVALLTFSQPILKENITIGVEYLRGEKNKSCLF